MLLKQTDLNAPPGTVNSMAGHSLAARPSLRVMQTRKGCFQVNTLDSNHLTWVIHVSLCRAQTFMGCDANEEFKISTLEDPNGVFLYVREETGCCTRFCLGSSRPFHMKMYNGKDQSATSGPVVTSFHRFCKLPIGSLKCCCYQELEILDRGTQPIGRVQENCWLCVPAFNVYKPDGQAEYLISPPTCLGGICVDICAEGCCNCRIPVYLYPPGSPSTDRNAKIGKIVKIWAGLGNELFTNAHTFEVEFPKEAAADSKARILGGVLLVNEVFFQKDSNPGGGD